MGPMSPVRADSRWAGLCPVKLTENVNFFAQKKLNKRIF